MRKELKIGIFAVVIIVIAFFTLNFLRGSDILDRKLELVSGYEDVNGLLVSAPVYIKGYKAGRVDAVEYNDEDRLFYVTCSVSKDFSIPVDSRMVIYAVDIMGSKGVRLDYGDSEEFVSDGDTLLPVLEYGLMDGLANSVTPLMSKLSLTLDSLSVTVSGVNRLLSYDNISSINRTLANLDITIANVKKLSSSVSGKSDEINDLIDNLAELSASLNRISEKVDTTVNGVNNVVSSLDKADIEGVVSSMKSLIDNVNDPEGSVGKLLVDDSIYNSVDSLLHDVNILVDKIQENPKKYLKISVF